MDGVTASQVTFAGRYTIKHELGSGATSTVYLAHDTAHDRPVALKVLRQDLAEGIAGDRFLREINVSAHLNHPRIAPLLDSGEEAGKLFFVLPYLEGGSLRQRLQRERQLPLEVAIAITRSIADALDYAHAHGLIHRDVKPENILFTSGEACLVDFGIARAIERAAGQSATETGIALGTPMYMSPEQAAADRVIDGRSDIYSLACVFYEMLIGEPPFTGPTAQAVIARHLNDRPHDLRIVRPTLPGHIQSIVEKALAKTAADRYQSAAAFVDALDHPPVREAGARRILAVASTSLVVLLAVVAMRVLGVWHSTARAPPTLDPRRIAVLEFEDQSPDHSVGHIASGLTVSLIHELSSVSAIRVSSRNHVKALREAGIPLDSIVSALRVGSFVDGTVQRSNDRIRVTVQLVDVATRTGIETAKVESPMDELFMLEDRLAHQVAVLLRRRIGMDVRIREIPAGTASGPARDLVFRAEKLREDADSLATLGDTTELTAALRQLNRADSVLLAAEAADPRWLTPIIDRGWVALQLARYHHGAMNKRAAFRRAIEHADHALARDSANASALELRGAARYWQVSELTDDDIDDPLSRAEADLRRAVSRDTSLVSAWGLLSLVRLARGDVVEAQRHATTALAMDTYLEDGPVILRALFAANLMKGDFGSSWRWCDQGNRDYPRDVRFVECRLTLLAVDESRAPDPKLAWALVTRANEIDPPAHSAHEYQPILREMMAAVVSARAGETDTARATSRRAWAKIGVRPDLRRDLEYDDAYLHLILGEPGETIRQLSDYLAGRASLRAVIARDPRWSRLRSDPAFKRLAHGPQH